MRSVLLSSQRRMHLLLRAKLGALIIVTLVVAAVTAPTLVRDDPVGTLGLRFYLLMIIHAAIIGSGVVSADLGNGAGQLWLQRPVRPITFYLLRQAEAIWMAVLLCVIASLAVRLAGDWFGLTLDPDPITNLPVLLVNCGMMVALAFGASSWMSRGNTLVVLVFWVGSAILDIEFVEMDAWYVEVVRAVVVPIQAASALGDVWIRGDDGSALIELARIAAFLVTWTPIGSVGVWYATTRGGLARGGSR